MSDYVVRGVSQTLGEPSLQADVHCSGSSGWFAGAWAASIKPNASESTGTELNLYLGYPWALSDDWRARLLAVRYEYQQSSLRRYAHSELMGTLDYADRVFLTFAASPWTSMRTAGGLRTNRAAYFYDLAVRQPLPHALSAGLGLGYADLHRLVGTGYAYWNASLGYDWGAAHLDVSYVGTNTAAKSLFPVEKVEDRAVVTVLWRF